MSGKALWTELRRRGVLGAIATYGVVAAGALQLADVVSHGLDMPPWTIKAIIWASVAGLPIVGVVSWFYDLTKQGLVRTEAPRDRVSPSPLLVPLPESSSPRPAARAPLDAHALSPASAPLAGRYRIERELGAGGMGRVLSALDEKLGRRVAIKVLTGAHDAGRLARFSQEARTAGALEHPNVLAVYDLGDHDGSPFLVTELLDGATLREVIAKGPVDADAARKIALQLARGLEAAHARGVVHRDLKPENLFLTRDGRLKILDFGLAKLTAPNDEPAAPGLTVTGSIFGTPGYLAPEQAKGLTSDARSDIFAAGTVLYELLSGARAFPGGSLVEAGHAALTQEPAPLVRAPAALARVVKKCLEKDPARRFQNGAELVVALENLEVETAPRAVAIKSWEERWRGFPIWFRAGFFGVLALAALSGFGELTHSIKYGFRAAIGEDEPKQEANPVLPPGLERGLGPRAPLPALPPIPVVPAAPMRPRAPLPAMAPQPPEAQAEQEGQDGRDKDDEDGANKLVDQALKSIPKVAGIDVEKLQAEINQAIAKRKQGGAAGLAGTLNGAQALIAAKQYSQAESLLRKQIAREPEQIYPRLFLFALERRMGAGEQAALELGAFVKAADDDDWCMPIANFYLGELSEEELFAKAADEDDAEERESQICEASYYAGLFYESATPPDLERARHYFERSAASTANDLERGFAAEELSRIDHAQPAPHPEPHPQVRARPKRAKPTE